MNARLKTARERSGCGYLVVTCFFTCVMLGINSALAYEAHLLLRRSFGHTIQSDGLWKLFLFAVPVLMVIMEWKLFDLTVHTIQSIRRRF